MGTPEQIHSAGWMGVAWLRRRSSSVQVVPTEPHHHALNTLFAGALWVPCPSATGWGPGGVGGSELGTGPCRLRHVIGVPPVTPRTSEVI